MPHRHKGRRIAYLYYPFAQNIANNINEFRIYFLSSCGICFSFSCVLLYGRAAANNNNDVVADPDMRLYRL